jgi:hypothetical protein
LGGLRPAGAVAEPQTGQVRDEVAAGVSKRLELPAQAGHQPRTCRISLSVSAHAETRALNGYADDPCHPEEHRSSEHHSVPSYDEHIKANIVHINRGQGGR